MRRSILIYNDDTKCDKTCVVFARRFNCFRKCDYSFNKESCFFNKNRRFNENKNFERLMRNYFSDKEN